MAKSIRIKQHREEFSSGLIGQKYRTEVKVTSFDALLKRLGLTEDNCHLNEECAAWCKAKRNAKYIPEVVLYRLKTKSLYDEESAPYSLAESGVIIPEPLPLQEVEV